MERLTPNDFFPITSCVVFAQLPGYRGDSELHKQAAKPLAPGNVEIWSGPTDTPMVKRAVAPLVHDDGVFRSPYAVYANQGPSIRDRRLFFVSAHPNENRFAPPDTFVTYPRTGSLDKKTYSVAELDGQVVGGDNLFDVYLGESLAPYVALPPLTAALPASKAAMSMPQDDAGEVDRQELDANMRARWEKMERLWDTNKGKNDAKSLTQRLNYHSILTSQMDYLRDPGDRPVRIAYTTSGRPTAAVLADNQAIVDEKLYQVSCRDLDEAHYLLAIINSLALEEAVRDFRPTGQFGARHLHKHLWKLPIPEYDASNESHAALSQLGRTAAHECRELIAGPAASNAAANARPTAAAARARLRNAWQPASQTAQAIETAVSKLLAAG